MPVKQKISLKDISAVVASKTVLINLPVGYRYHDITIEHGYAAGTNTIAAGHTNISELRVKLNNRVQRRFSATQLRDANLLNGVAYDSLVGGVPNTAPGVSVPLYFAEPWRDNPLFRDSLAWATRGFGSFQIEVDLGAASTPTIAAWATVDEVAFDKPQMITKILPASIPAAGTKFDYTLADQSGFLTGLSLYPDSGGSNAATPVTLRKGTKAIVDAVTTTAMRAHLQNMRLSPAASGRTASIYDIVLDADDLPDSALPMDASRDITLTVEAASAMSGTITALIQRLGFPE